MAEYGNITHYSHDDDEDRNRAICQLHYDVTRRQYPQIPFTGNWELIKHQMPLSGQIWWAWYEEING